MPSPMSVTSGCVAFRVGSLCSTSLPHRGYAAVPPSPACTVSGDLVSADSWEPSDSAMLFSSVRPASSEVHRHSVHLCVKQRCSCLACRNRGPAGEGHERDSPSG